MGYFEQLEKEKKDKGIDLDFYKYFDTNYLSKFLLEDKQVNIN